MGDKATRNIAKRVISGRDINKPSPAKQNKSDLTDARSPTISLVMSLDFQQDDLADFLNRPLHPIYDKYGLFDKVKQ
jgi:hypothetical protein